MKVWYSCKVKHTTVTEEGESKQVTDNYLVDAVSYTDAEKRIYELSEQEVSGEFTITNISKTNISEVINYEDSEQWFKCKVAYVTLDATTDKESKINTYFLVGADNIKQAFERVEDNLSSMLVPFEIPSIALTNFLEVFPYVEGEEIPDNLKPLETEASNVE